MFLRGIIALWHSTTVRDTQLLALDDDDIPLCETSTREEPEIKFVPGPTNGIKPLKSALKSLELPPIKPGIKKQVSHSDLKTETKKLESTEPKKLNRAYTWPPFPFKWMQSTETLPYLPNEPIRRDAVTEWSRRNEMFAPNIILPTPVRFIDLPTEMRMSLCQFLPPADDENSVVLQGELRMRLQMPGNNDSTTNNIHHLNLMKMIELEELDLIVCRDCKSLHKPTQPLGNIHKAARIKSYYPTKPCHLLPPRDDSCCLGNLTLGRTCGAVPILPYIFSFSMLQLAMKRHRVGLPSPQILSPLNSHRIYQRHDWKHLWSAKSKILGDRLVVRTQHWFFLSPYVKHSDVVFRHILCNTSRRERDGGLLLCQHAPTLDVVADKLFKEIPPRKARDKWSVLQYASATRVLHCSKCPTQFKVDLDVTRESDPKTKVMVITAWRDFGNCQNCYDPYFISHFGDFNEESYMLDPIMERLDPSHVYVTQDLMNIDDRNTNLAYDFEKEQDDAGQIWTVKWVGWLRNAGLWDEMRRYDPYGRGERPWHELDSSKEEPKKPQKLWGII